MPAAMRCAVPAWASSAQEPGAPHTQWAGGSWQCSHEKPADQPSAQSPQAQPWWSRKWALALAPVPPTAADCWLSPDPGAAAPPQAQPAHTYLRSAVRVGARDLGVQHRRGVHPYISSALLRDSSFSAAMCMGLVPGVLQTHPWPLPLCPHPTPSPPPSCGDSSSITFHA